MKKMRFINSEIYEYEVYKIVDIHAPILKVVCKPFNFESPQINSKLLANSLQETMVHNWGIGLASNQIGLPYRVFSMGGNKVAYTCFNPEILSIEGEDVFQEGCLSAPGLFLKIKRPTTITVRYQTFDGVSKEETFSGLTAKIFQHELDHLNGVVFTSLVSPITLDIAKRKVKKNLKLLAVQRKQAEKDRIIQQALENVLQEQKQKEKEALNSLVLNIPSDLTIKL